MIQASQRMIRQQNCPAVNGHFELQIKTLIQKAPRDVGKRLNIKTFSHGAKDGLGKLDGSSISNMTKLFTGSRRDTSIP
jgi:hypothetical protein